MPPRDKGLRAQQKALGTLLRLRSLRNPVSTGQLSHSKPENTEEPGRVAGVSLACAEGNAFDGQKEVGKEGAATKM
jgi:hypothetical protein